MDARQLNEDAALEAAFTARAAQLQNASRASTGAFTQEELAAFQNKQGVYIATEEGSGPFAFSALEYLVSNACKQARANPDDAPSLFK